MFIPPGGDALLPLLSRHLVLVHDSGEKQKNKERAINLLLHKYIHLQYHFNYEFQVPVQ
jgi:hypothetical protein